MALKMSRMKLGWAAKAHFTNLYPMLDGLGVDLFDVLARASSTSRFIMGWNGCFGNGSPGRLITGCSR